ncbi:hypothetical protein CGLO_10448 [Colletotrichum gloeosporioides Cg-14]|uniref:Uncharacterized protein n=1 Tax=Colletotrichum gloeosporioides (strain Cg-14) TaxID=1237896 RepID=T0LEY6_COLGC|nr:hypothetical protein CGLO_10448 [Colletotrichum gloeosporioides Cg-14]
MPIVGGKLHYMIAVA